MAHLGRSPRGTGRVAVAPHATPLARPSHGPRSPLTLNRAHRANPPCRRPGGAECTGRQPLVSPFAHILACLAPLHESLHQRAHQVGAAMSTMIPEIRGIAGPAGPNPARPNACGFHLSQPCDDLGRSYSSPPLWSAATRRRFLSPLE